ncbi:restriction endonuclease [bacterium]|nr:MAG: restriction endonuclease [bacterium]
MLTCFDRKLADAYTSNSQKIRVLSEAWVSSEIYCPNCGTGVDSHRNNRPVADFYCAKCSEDFELKSKKNSSGSRIVDGAYDTMIKRLQGDDNPNFFLLNYSPVNYEVLNFAVVPKHFFTPEIIEKRKPLSPAAKRGAWVGCNILINNIPHAGKIFYVKDRQIQPTEKVLENWKKTLFLRDEKETKGWIVDVMNCLDKIDKTEFNLQDVYSYELFLQQKHPDNRHVKDKIRQQLQFLRDKGYLEFVSKGSYRLI